MALRAADEETRGILEVRYRVKETNAATLRALLPYHGRRMIDVDAVGLLAHAHQRGLCVAERRNGPRVGRQLDEHDVTRIDQDACDQVESLLRAARDENLVTRGANVTIGEDLNDAVEQRTETPRRAVLQDGPVASSQELACDLPEIAPREHLGRGIPGRERDDVGYLRLQHPHSPDRRLSHPISRRREEPLVVDHAVDAQGVVRTPLPAALAWLSRYV